MPSLLPNLRSSPVGDTRKIRQSGCSIHQLSCASHFRMIDGDSRMVSVACPLRTTRLRLALFPLSSSNARHPASAQIATLAPGSPFGASKLHSLTRPRSHVLKPVDEYCTTPFCNGAFRGEIRYNKWCTLTTYLSEARIIPLKVALQARRLGGALGARAPSRHGESPGESGSMGLLGRHV